MKLITENSTAEVVEKDKVEILSGVFEGKTLGAPICAIVRNEDIGTSEYVVLKNIY